MNTKCEFCGLTHEGMRCFRVKAIEYYENGTIKKVELHDIPQITQNVGPITPTSRMHG